MYLSHIITCSLWFCKNENNTSSYSVFVWLLTYTDAAVDLIQQQVTRILTTNTRYYYLMLHPCNLVTNVHPRSAHVQPLTFTVYHVDGATVRDRCFKASREFVMKKYGPLCDLRFWTFVRGFCGSWNVLGRQKCTGSYRLIADRCKKLGKM